MDIVELNRGSHMTCGPEGGLEDVAMGRVWRVSTEVQTVQPKRVRGTKNSAHILGAANLIQYKPQGHLVNV